MEEVLSAVNRLAALLSPARIDSVANCIGRSSSSEVDAAIHRVVTTPTARSALEEMLRVWEKTKIPGNVLSGMLLGASFARTKIQTENAVELVLTGPTTRYVATRRTEQVLLDLINQSISELFVVSFVAYSVPTVVSALNAAIIRGVKVRILVESSSEHGGSLDVDPAAIMQKYVPSADIYAWLGRDQAFIDGRVHAKVAVSDGQKAFITSANLTGYALEKNMEAGVLVTGGSVANDLQNHLAALVETGIVQKVS